MNFISRIALACALVFLPVAHAQEGHHEWDYSAEHGPQQWGEKFETCAAGKQQSPIDIRNAERADLDPIRFDYQPAALRIIDNGHTIQVNYAPGSRIAIGGMRYELVQFHFHQPSEERIDGAGYPMVAHLVHKDAGGALAVVAVLLKQGAANPLLRTVLANLPREKEKEEVFETVGINAESLLPADPAYYTFNGSLTTPPCSEGVTWFVLVNPVEISSEQLAQFGQLYHGNARPVQPLNGRTVKMSR